MKKISFVIGSAAAVLLLFTGCPKNTDPETETSDPVENPSDPEETDPEVEAFTPVLDVDLDVKKAAYGEFTITSDAEYEENDGIITLSPTEEGTEYVLSGYYNGQIVNSTKNTVIKLNNAYIENDNGEPAILSSAKFEISTAEGSENYVISNGSSEDKTAAIYCYDAAKEKSKNLELGGSGICYVYGNVTHGIKADEIKAKGSGVYYAAGTSKGSAFNCKTFVIAEEKTVTIVAFNSKNGIKADESIDIKSGTIYLASLSTGLKTDISADDDEGEEIDHYISLSGCSIYTRSIEKSIYSTEEDKLTKAEDVTEAEF